jgi:hypothetical protein
MTALMALHIGCDTERISAVLRWRDFEALTVEILERFGYTTQTNVHLRKPRCEIDVIGINSRFAIVIFDRKHWKRSNVSSISCYAKKQLKRRELLLQNQTKIITSAIPLLVTLHYQNVNFVKVPIIPINLLNTFLNELDLNLDVIQVLRE